MHNSSAQQSRVRLILGDITKLETDAIVTAANPALAGGGGVDGAIHRAAGPELMRACLALGGCPTGEACITPGFNLKAKHVIHAVGPIYMGGGQREAERLAGAYRASLHLCEEHGLQSVAFPSISTGAYEFPREEASRIAVETVTAWLDTHALPQTVVFCCFAQADADVYASQLGSDIERI